MSKSGQEFERRLDLAKYSMHEALLKVRDKSALHKQENGYYLLRLDYATWKLACDALSLVEKPYKEKK